MMQEKKKDGRVSFEPQQPQPIDGFSDFGNLDLQGVTNARDLGGMPAADGRRIKVHRLLRSGDLDTLTALDVRTLLDACELQHIVDLRTEAEIQRDRDPVLRMPGVSYVFTPALSQDEVMGADVSDMKSDAHIVAEFAFDAQRYMREMYPKCLLGNAGQKAYRELFEGLLEADEGATLWHCTQGKDRTGIAAMLVEHSLGVSMRDIEQDYLATNLFMGGWLRKFEGILSALGVAKLLDRDIAAYIYADIDNLRAGIDAVTKEYGSLDAYMEKALGVGDDEKNQMRAMYLE